MCRLFGLIANKAVDVEFSLLEAPNNLRGQSRVHRDGWGIGWYEKGRPLISKEALPAYNSESFQLKVKNVKSPIVIAHVRQASSGAVSKENSHPFSHENWIFAHNGTLYEEDLFEALMPPYSENLTSEGIDSELYFRYILQCIAEENDVIKGIRKATDLAKMLGKANFLLSDGKNLYAYCSGYSLYILERKYTKPIGHASPETRSMIVSKLSAHEQAVIFASEKLTNDENWKPLEDDTLVMVTPDLQCYYL